MLCAVLKALHQVKSTDAASRPFALIVLKTDDDRRPAVFFHDARCDNAEHSCMPAIAGEHQGMTTAAIHHGSGAGKSLFKHSRLHRPTLDIMRLEFLSNARCSFVRFR